jgi:hypothetical protein
MACLKVDGLKRLTLTTSEHYRGRAGLVARPGAASRLDRAVRRRVDGPPGDLLVRKGAWPEQFTLEQRVPYGRCVPAPAAWGGNAPGIEGVANGAKGRCAGFADLGNDRQHGRPGDRLRP